MAKKTLFFVLLSCLLFGLVLLSKAQLATSHNHQHDFVSYYYGAKALLAGQNGYDSHVVSALSGTTHQSHLRFVYPPQIAYVFAPLTRLSFDTARLVFLGIKMVLIGVLFWLFLRFFVHHRETNDIPAPIQAGRTFMFCVIALFAFRGPFVGDMLSGNIATLESLLLWGGILFLLSGRGYWGVVLIALGGSFKLLPLVFLGIVFLTPLRQKWRLFGTGILIATLVQVLGLWRMPQHYVHFLTSPHPLDSSGYVNPSLLALLQIDLGTWLSQYNISPVMLYAGFACGILVVTSSLLWKHRTRYTLLSQICILVLTYGLVSPRLKDYTFIMFLIPAYKAFVALPKHWQKGGYLLLLGVTLWPYHHWTMVLLTWGILLRYAESRDAA